MTWLETDRLPAGQLELEGPWNFQLRNPSNPAASTYAGVLEFIAREGVVHLPQWVWWLIGSNCLRLLMYF